MTDIIKKRMCGEIEGEFVVFLIGARINKPWKVWKWWPVATAMVIQYWRSFEHLEAYAKQRDLAHLPAWQAFNKAVASDGDVGIWHETYVIAPGKYENIYNNMPPYGLGAVGRIVDAV